MAYARATNQNQENTSKYNPKKMMHVHSVTYAARQQLKKTKNRQATYRSLDIGLINARKDRLCRLKNNLINESL